MNAEFKTFGGPAEQARQFLIRRVMEQASQEQVVLSPVEQRMLGFSESMDGEPDLDAAEEFEQQEDAAGFEKKISVLVRHAYKIDKQAGRDHEWKQALDTLRDSDFYLLVMVQQAGLRVPVSWASALPDRTILLLCIFLAVFFCGGYVVFFRLRDHSIQLPALLVWLAALWFLSRKRVMFWMDNF